MLKKIIICGNISLVIVPWADIFIVYIALIPIFTFSRKCCRQYNHIFQLCSHHSMVRPNCCITAMELAAPPPPELFLHWQPYLMNVWWTYECLVHRDICTLKLFLGVPSQFLHDSIDNNYCKKDHSKDDENEVEITQTNLRKNEEQCGYGKFLLFRL